jgi:hypothetical protein
MEWLAATFPALEKSLGPVLAVAVIVAASLIVFFLQRNPQRMASADADGQIAAIDVWKELADSANAARAVAESRADMFAKERNDALQQLWEMRGQLKVLTDEVTRLRELVASQNDELHGLRDQLSALKEQINAKP